MCGSAGTGDDDLDAPFACLTRVLRCACGRAVRGGDVDLVFDTELLESLGGFIHDFEVAVATHDDGYKRSHFQFSVLRLVMRGDCPRRNLFLLLYRRLLESAMRYVAPILHAFE